MRRHTLVVVALVTLVASLVLLADARPNRYGHSDREERHMFPAVSSGPLDPAWSPDGQWLAFSLRGDIWKMPAAGGTAVALTSGPAYHFEPAWSPDGRRIAFTLDVEGNLEIGVVGADGGEVQRVSPHPRVDLQPAWARDGRSLFFVSARAGGWRIFRHDLATGSDSAVIAGIQPAVSPDGTLLAYEQGGLRILNLESMQSVLVRAEESEYRVRPAWLPDGSGLLYVTEERGSNDIRLIASGGGDPIDLTTDPDYHEMSPAPSPDGLSFAFVSFLDGVPHLYTLGIAGGRREQWKELAITERRSSKPVGRVHVQVLGANGRPTPARVHLRASDGRGYAPDGTFQRAMMVFDEHYFHTGGVFEIELPAGPATIEALRGWSYTPARALHQVRVGTIDTVVLQPEPILDLAASGWYSGDSHLHDLHQGFGLSHVGFFLQQLAEDINVANPLVHMDGTRLMGRWADLTGRPHFLSMPLHILQYGQEFRGGLGHIGMIGTREYVLPFVSGQSGTPYAQQSLDHEYILQARGQGGMAGYMHPYLTEPRTPAAAASTLIAMDAALGLGDYYDVGALYSDELGSAAFYYRLLNAGFRIPATGGTDNFSDVFRDPPPGSARTFARIEGRLSMSSWMDAIRRGRTFMSTGPLLFMSVDGREPGDEIRLLAGATGILPVSVEARSIAPLDSLQILVNGEVVQSVRATDSLHVVFTGTVAVPDGGWVAARVVGPASRLLGDDYAFAHTGPVYVLAGGVPFVSRADVEFLAQTVAAIRNRVSRTRWRSEAERQRFTAALDSADAVYADLARRSRNR